MNKSAYIHKSHNVSELIYHIVCLSKNRKVVLSEVVDQRHKESCLEISKRYQIHFLEIGTDNNHVHFLVQSVPSYNITKTVTINKSITPREIFQHHPDVKKQLWGGEFWSDGYFVNTVSKFGDETTISQYVNSKGTENEYKQLHKPTQLNLF